MFLQLGCMSPGTTVMVQLKNVSNGIEEKPWYILKTSVRSDLFLCSSSDHSFRILSLIR